MDDWILDVALEANVKALLTEAGGANNKRKANVDNRNIIRLVRRLVEMVSAAKAGCTIRLCSLLLSIDLSSWGSLAFTILNSDPVGCRQQ